MRARSRSASSRARATTTHVTAIKGHPFGAFELSTARFPIARRPAARAGPAQQGRRDRQELRRARPRDGRRAARGTRSSSSSRRRRSSGRATRSRTPRSPTRSTTRPSSAVVIGRLCRDVPLRARPRGRPRLHRGQRRDGPRPPAQRRAVDARQGLRHVLPARSVGRDRARPERPRRARARSTARCARTARTADLIHDVPELIAYVSAVMTLLPGDVILTGTPAGVGPARGRRRGVGDRRGRRHADQPGRAPWLSPRATPVRLRVAPSPDRRPARRHGLHVAVQPGLRPPAGRPVRAAHRGHRPGALRRGQRAADLRHAALARAATGTRARTRAARSRRTASPSGSTIYRPLRRAAARRRPRLPLLVQPERLAEMREAQQKAKQADRLRPALPRQDARGAGGAAGVQRDARRAHADPGRRRR